MLVVFYLTSLIVIQFIEAVSMILVAVTIAIWISITNSGGAKGDRGIRRSVTS